MSSTNSSLIVGIFLGDEGAWEGDSLPVFTGNGGRDASSEECSDEASTDLERVLSRGRGGLGGGAGLSKDFACAGV